jgi:hypothetical protein
MIIAKLLESMIGDGAEFESFPVMIDIDVATDVRDLAYQMGVPVNRLLAELVSQGIREARSEWRALDFGRATPVEPAQAYTPKFSLSPRIK